MIRKSALLLDFDNVFSGIWSLDQALGERFATEPVEWLQALTTSFIDAGARRFLTLRCYLNPSGYVVLPQTGERYHFARLRPAFMRAGFEVIDCPALTRANKNAADIRMVLDAIDLLDHRTRYDEFLIASGDSDFTPLLRRIRADDRLTGIISPGNLASAYASLADMILGFDELQALLRPDEANAAVSEPDDAREFVEPNEKLRVRFVEFVSKAYADASKPMNLASLAHATNREVPEAKASKWLGHGTFVSALESLSLPGAAITNQYLWDTDRHLDPASGERLDLPPACLTLVRELSVPPLETAKWTSIFEALARYAVEHDFNLAQSTGWTRDYLTQRGTEVSRKALEYVVRGTQMGGAPLNAVPPPDANAIANAFLGNLIARGLAAAVELSREDEDALAGWMGLAMIDAGHQQGIA
ncbi:hypothetical protein B2G71_06790 [Novosphingobium sp. PC22D]|uniref:NYN domain-containing protein n=1 Tax=Novosphingobium sp. PC22D TaxID=1962403 RepID=UPI000BFAEE2E|nr:NYN domain-containing protein [Novosphingobium sp. PC22D]PEQ13155.1 hypothetical protein B2G71_06790 [Novosphingobium sp. PC22D]